MIKTPVFVSGIGRSGTSAVIKAMAQHKDVVTPERIGEAPFVGHFVNFLHEYEDKSPAREYHFLNYQLDEEERAAQFSKLLAMLQYGKDISGEEYEGKHWIAKVSLAEDAFEKSQSIMGGVKCIYVMRNGVEVVNSAKSFHGFADLSFEQLCTRWVTNIEQCTYVHSHAQCAVIRHHELVAEPKKVFNQVFEQLGFQADDAPAEFIATNLFNSSFDKKATGASSTEGVFNSRLNCWSEWSDEEKSTFKRICDQKMIEYGFERPYESEIADGDVMGLNAAKSTKENAVVQSITKNSSETKKATELSSEQKQELQGVKRGICESLYLSQYDYFANPSFANKYFFMENPKVASTTLLKALQSQELGNGSEGHKHPPHDREKSPIPLISELNDEDQWRMYFSDEIFRFSFVRNPYSRLLSGYLSKIDTHWSPEAEAKALKNHVPKVQILATIKGVSRDDIVDINEPVSFDEFVEVVCSESGKSMNPHWKPQVEQMLVNTINFDFLGRFENFAEDYAYVSEKLFGVEGSQLEVSANRTSSSSKLDRFYNPDIQKKVFERFEADFESLGYSEDISKLECVDAQKKTKLKLVG